MADATVMERAPQSRVQLKSASAIAFAPNGVLLVGDGLGAAVYAFETGDVTRTGSGPIQIDDLTGKIAALLGTTVGPDPRARHRGQSRPPAPSISPWPAAPAPTPTT